MTHSKKSSCTNFQRVGRAWDCIEGKKSCSGTCLTYKQR